MQPVQIVVRDMPNSPVLEDHIRKKAEKLHQFYDRINTCRVVVEVPQKHKRHGKLFCVRIDIRVPGKELVVNRKLDEDVYVAIRDAFNALLRQLEEYSRKRRGAVKTHESETYGHVHKLFIDEGYGFIQGLDGNDHYFNESNVVYPSFEQLTIGDTVQFIGLPGTDGWKAQHIKKVS